MDDREVITEFLVESNENLGRLDQEMVELEQRPKDAQLLASIFRTIHTIKGTCGFLGFANIERITHHAETILSQVREGKRDLTPGLVSLVLETVDAVKAELEVIESTLAESGEVYQDLVNRLEATASDLNSTGAPSSAKQHGESAVSAKGEGKGESKGEGKATNPSGKEASASSANTSTPAVAETDLVSTQAVVNKALATPQKDSSAAESSGNGGELVEASYSEEETPLASEAAAKVPATNGKAGGKTASPANPPASGTDTKPSPSQAATKPTGGGADTGKTNSVADSSIRVDVGVLDRLMNLVGELVLARNQVLQFSTRMEDTGFEATTQRLNLITSELQESVMKTRMQPIGTVWNKLPRIVRDVSSLLGKQINLVMEGAETELDRTVIETIKDPLTHIVRNACDHGVESPEVRLGRGKPAAGTLSLKAFHEGGSVNIEISDDGGGIDPQRVKNKAIEKGLLRPEQAERMSDRELTQLIFLPGFSTAGQVTNISGRGVGMDVVKTNVEKIGGSVDVVSTPGRGATVRVKLPLTLAIIPGLLVSSRTIRFVIPQVNLVELLRLEAEELQAQVQWVHDSPVFRRRGQLLPLVFLDKALGLRAATASAANETTLSKVSEGLNIAVLQAESHQFGLVVDGVHDTQEIVVKPLDKMLKALTTYAGATILGDGTVSLILDVMGLAQRAGIQTSTVNGRQLDEARENYSLEERQNFLIFQAGDYKRLAVPLSVVTRLEELTPDRIEYAAGRPVVQYRDRILHLIPLQNLLGGQPSAPSTDGTIPVIVFTRGSRWIGLQVDHIVDIVEATPEMSEHGSSLHIFGSAVLDGNITDFLDLASVINTVDPAWLEEQSTEMADIHQARRKAANLAKKRAVLLADPSSFDRGNLRAVLEIAGYRVKESSSLQAARQAIASEEFDLTLTSLEWPEDELVEFLGAAANYPIVGLARAGQNIPDEVHPRFTAIVDRQDRASMIADLGRLLKSMSQDQYDNQPTYDLVG